MSNPSAQPARLIKPEEVGALRSQLDPYVKALGKSITDAVPANVREAWGLFALGWQRYCADPPSWSRAPLQIADGEKFASLVVSWKTLLTQHYGEASPNGMQLVRFFTWSSELQNLKRDVKGLVQAIEQSIAACPNFPAAERTAWIADATEWREFEAKPIDTWDNTTDYEFGQRIQDKMIAWQSRIPHLGCAATGPMQRPTVGSPEADRQTHKEEDDRADKAATRPVPLPSWGAPIMMVAGVAGLIALLGFGGKLLPMLPMKGKTA